MTKWPPFSYEIIEARVSIIFPGAMRQDARMRAGPSGEILVGSAIRAISLLYASRTRVRSADASARSREQTKNG
jgi:hypothetical protein